MEPLISSSKFNFLFTIKLVIKFIQPQASPKIPIIQSNFA